MSLLKEIEELVAEFDRTAHPGEPLNVWLHHVAREANDVLHQLLKAGTDPVAIQNDLIRAGNLLITKLGLGGFAATGARFALQSGVPQLVNLAAPYAGNAQGFLDEVIVPALDLWIETLTDFRKDLGSK